jgi:glycosyltransferase involved in cell wall biosynthesis
MRGIKVLIISSYPIFPGTVIGGVEAVASALAPALASQQGIAQVIVACFHKDVPARQTRRLGDNLEVWYLPAQRRLSLPTRSCLEFLQVRRIARLKEPDVIHVQGIGSIGDLTTRLPHPAVVTIHGLVHVEARMASKGTPADRLRVWLVECMVQRVLRQARVAISTSGYDARSLKSFIHNRHMTIANPVAPEFFNTAGSPEGKTILFAGMLVRRKNIEGILHAMISVVHIVPDARLVIVGPTPDPIYRCEILDMVKNLRLEKSVTFRGLIDNYELVRELVQSSCLVLFSNEETSPTIVAQAMAVGRAVVASGVGGIPELVLEGKNGFLVSSKDEQTLAERLIMILESPVLSKHMGDQGRVIALERFEPVSVARQTIAAYRLAMES